MVIRTNTKSIGAIILLLLAGCRLNTQSDFIVANKTSYTVAVWVAGSTDGSVTVSPEEVALIASLEEAEYTFYAMPTPNYAQIYWTVTVYMDRVFVWRLESD